MTLTLTERRKIGPMPEVPISRNVTWQAQLQSNWCWAACISMANNYYNAAAVTQCTVANTVLGITGCCNNPCPNACNVPLAFNSNSSALATVRILAAMLTGAAPLATVSSQILYNHIVEVGFVWTASGGHFALIDGADTTAGTVRVKDPWYGASWLNYQYVVAGYGQGNWTYTWAMSH